RRLQCDGGRRAESVPAPPSYTGRASATTTERAAMRTRFMGALLPLVLSAPLHAQSVDLGAANAGLSIGNSPVWTGVRINWRDRDVQRVNGLNITIWRPSEDNTDFVMN